MMYFPRKVGIILFGRFENHLLHSQSIASPDSLDVEKASLTFEPLVSLCVAKYTFPKDPLPMSRPKA